MLSMYILDSGTNPSAIRINIKKPARPSATDFAVPSMLGFKKFLFSLGSGSQTLDLRILKIISLIKNLMLQIQLNL